MRRRRWIALSIVVAGIATAAIMIVGDHYESLSLLALQVPLLAILIAGPLLFAAVQRRGTPWSWTVAAVILAAGWGYVVYVDAQPDRGGGASLAVVIGWMASALAFCVPIVAAIVMRMVTSDGRWRRSPAADRSG